MFENEKNILDRLNPQQEEAVCFGEGPLMIIAGAGTGKTSVITRRIAYLIASKRAYPNEILALTFTDKAAAEMEERVDILLPYGFANIQISTFHSFGDRILRNHSLELGLSPDFRVLSKAEQIIFFREHLFEFPLSYYRPLGNPTRYIDAVLTLISRAKDEAVSPEEYSLYVQELNRLIEIETERREELEELTAQQLELAQTYTKYQELMAQKGNIDFGDQIALVLKLFEDHPSVLKRFQNKFKYILVDEFQDTNYAQFDLVRKLAGDNGNVTVVCDDDQSIYKFRGAAISNILKFRDTYPASKLVVLTRNYRSSQKILDSAYRLILHNNPDRLEDRENITKKLLATEKLEAVVEHLHFNSISAESDAVAEMIEKKAGSGDYRFRDFAILVRTNNDADPFLRSLNMRGIPYQFSGSRGLYHREEVRLLISFLRALTNFNDSISLYHLASSDIYQFPMDELVQCLNFARQANRGLHYVMQHLDQIPELAQLSVELKASAQKLFGDLRRYLEISRQNSAGSVLYQFITESGYLKRLVDEGNPEAEVKVLNIARFFEVVRGYSNLGVADDVHSFVTHLDLLIEAGDDPATAEADIDMEAVHILTVHKSKGLEFPVVFLVSLVQNKFPLPGRSELLELPDSLVKDMLPEGEFHLQEERRLFYVGMTRAKKELYLTSARDYGGSRPRKISQFVLEALDRPRADETALKSSPLESIERFAPVSDSSLESPGRIPDEQILSLSNLQIEDYSTCPLKYKYIHILRVPVLPHHSMIYGRAIHEAIREYNRRKSMDRKVTLEDVLHVFELMWKNQGFLTREHEELRFKTGKDVLTRFFQEEENAVSKPTIVEQDFSFLQGNNRIIGRWDRIDESAEKVCIIDYKTSDVRTQKAADDKTRKSPQLLIYAEAYLMTYNRIPETIKYVFLETGFIGEVGVTENNLKKIRTQINEVSDGIRGRCYTPNPGFISCGYCAFSNVCPASVR
ncbi:ATP-dependent helicase [candidate division KSB1 bacterium]|nr:ATP-dependent helicase [candidate division KSB1 bacterium]